MKAELLNYRDCKTIAIMGGTFDPIHYGHLVVAEAVRNEFDIEKVIFMPVGSPPHKIGQKIASGNHRYLMSVLATVTNPYFDVSRLEIDRAGYTYTVDTIVEMKKLLPDDISIYFITGADAIHQIFSWKEPEKLLSICEFIAVTRPGYNDKKLFFEVENMEKQFKARIHFFEVPSFDISSSDIRDRIKNNRSVKYMLPEKVEDYIYKFELYKD